MAFFDYPLDILEQYRPDRNKPADFDTFWADTLADARRHDLAVTFAPVDVGITAHDVYDVTFPGFAGQPIRGWMLVPKHRDGTVPCVMEYLGYGGGRGFPHSYTLIASAGFAHFVMDTRGQGSAWQRGDTPDAGASGEPQYPGFLTRGLSSPSEHYYRRVFTDAVRAVEAARSHPDIDGRIVVSGGSQGGGISLAVAGLVDDLSGVYTSQPFLCHYRRAATCTDAAPYSELKSYFAQHVDRVEQSFATLDYMDGMNFSARANAPARFNVGLMDMVCPPSTVYAAYNHYAGPKSMDIYQFNGHDGGASFGNRARVDFLHKVLG
ncbi:MAG: acetylxylan esterase [Thermomicrobiales bacterium]|nr:acetylxylan esterase [Thermomicrobiales bacterium]